MALYFAYGSNMLTARLKARCPSATALGAVFLPDHDLAFDKISADGSAKATLAVAKGSRVAGVLFELDEGDLGALDQLEGTGFGYDAARLALPWQGAPVFARSYIAPPGFRDAKLRPYDWYLGLCVAGALEHGLPRDWIRRLIATPRCPDPDPARPRRIEADALLASCPAEWRLS
ncbi:gamma-glutamylcyclotransferase [Paracoccus aurantiacus]|uniref:Gamma-glutamylcyclotransferase n=1 Tax=Paracoccus aurantiacus TaxID=2599412 RepID=A0A5C6SAU7_9RHOB|nr:gamma-glutamylcyclotransferase family protein [Paracoccus aurantiacus]TXB71152.1 gamma-glutamylcyclotransferase [Paracoccus aurantiacus]